MDLRRLRYFLVTLEYGTISAAADELDISQPVLSRQLRKLEEELGVDLFFRDAGRVTPSANGMRFAEIARQLRDAEARADRAVEAMRRGESMSLRVAATSTTIATILAPFISQASPDLPILTSWAVGHHECFDALSGKADLAISPLPAPADIESTPLGEIPVRAWCCSDHRFAQDDSPVDVRDLAEETVAVYGRSAVSRGIVDAFMVATNTAPKDVVECDDIAVLEALARSGRAVSLTTGLAVGEGLASRRIWDGRTGAKMPDLGLQLAWQAGHYGATAIRELALERQSFLQGQLLRT